MIRRRGLNATSVRELAKHADTPLGSTYHYFPGGKRQLAVEAVRFAGDMVSAVLRARLADGPVAGLRAFLGLWRDVLIGTAFRAGCPVLAVSVEEPSEHSVDVREGAEDEPSAQAAAAGVFADWQALLTDCLRRQGVEAVRSEQLAALIIASVEGAIVMCRAQRSIEPFDKVCAQLKELVTAVIDNR